MFSKLRGRIVELRKNFNNKKKTNGKQKKRKHKKELVRNEEYTRESTLDQMKKEDQIIYLEDNKENTP